MEHNRARKRKRREGEEDKDDMAKRCVAQERGAVYARPAHARWQWRAGTTVEGNGGRWRPVVVRKAQMEQMQQMLLAHAVARTNGRAL